MFSDLIQQYKESDEAVRYMTFYKITDWPYIAIIDPRTGRILIFSHPSSNTNETNCARREYGDLVQDRLLNLP